MQFDQGQLVEFLLAAKLATYAAEGEGAAVPSLLPGAKQMEYALSPFLYRDIYFGMSYFAGQETVYFQEHPIWTLCYGGGVPRDFSAEQVRDTYRVLGKALRQVSQESPFRGPASFQNGDYLYTDAHVGTLENVRGEERISLRGVPVYSLSYFGGFIK